MTGALFRESQPTIHPSCSPTMFGGGKQARQFSVGTRCIYVVSFRASCFTIYIVHTR